MSLRFRLVPRVATVCFAFMAVVSLTAAKKEGPIRQLALDPDARVVELFDGLEAGVLTARVSARNEFESSVFIGNTSDAPLTVALPEGVAAVHVLKQNFPNQNPFGFDAALGPQTGTAGQGQPIGGVFGPAMGNGFPNFPGGQGPGGGNQFFNAGNQFPGGGFFSIPPEKTVQIQLRTVCLEHGRPHPTGRMTYVLRRLDEQVSDPALRQLLRTYDPETTDRMAVQAAAWHLANGMGWRELASKHNARGGLLSPYFTRAQLEAAYKLVEDAREQADDADPAPAETAPVRTAGK